MSTQQLMKATYLGGPLCYCVNYQFTNSVNPKNHLIRISSQKLIFLIQKELQYLLMVKAWTIISKAKILILI